MKTNHFNEDQIISSVIDSENLSYELKGHISQCTLCQKQKDDLERELLTVGVLAKKYSHVSKKSIRFVHEDLHKKSLHPWFLSPSLAAALVIMLVIGIWFFTPVKVPDESQVTYTIEEMERDEQIIYEIWDLEEQTFAWDSSDTNGDISSYLDEDFLEFVIPLEEENNSA
jgi:hypothetical protein